jgi:hypothetical protein
MRAQLAKGTLEATKQAGMRQVGGNFLKPVETKDKNGNVQTTYSVNPNAIQNILQFSDDPIADLNKYAQAIPNLRKSGLLGSRDAEGTPFDAMAMMITDPLIKAQVVQYAKQYKNGLMDDDKANTLSNQILTLATHQMTAKESQDFKQTMGILQTTIAQQGMAIRQSDENRKQEESGKKLSDEQKITYKSVVVPILNQGIKANDAILELDSMEKNINRLPETIVGNAKQYIFSTDAREAAREIEAATQRLKTLVPRLPGSQSNIDSANIEKGIGKLTDPTFSRADKIKIWTSVKDSFQRLSDDADRYEAYWNKYKKVAPSRAKVVLLDDIPSENEGKK